MLGVARLFCYKAGQFILVDVSIKEAKRRRLELLAEGYVITHTEVV